MASTEVVMVRSRDAGVFYGELVERKNDVVTLSEARRVWYWKGAATLSELATRGPSDPKGCKFPAAVPHIIVLGVCEIIEVSDVALEALDSVPVWTEQ